MPRRPINDIEWPGGASCAFTVFDDTDGQSIEIGTPVYDFLHDHNIRTSKSVWVNRAPDQTDQSGTCDEEEYLAWTKSLQKKGYEISWHMASSRTSQRSKTLAGLEKFQDLFGHYPYSAANHYECLENIYFGDKRVTNINRLLYNLLTRFKNYNTFKGDVVISPLFWGDCCQEKIKYVRNFVFRDINTLKQCPFMPYYDPTRPFVNNWFSASEGSNGDNFNHLLSPANVDRLIQERGACIVYTHFGLGFWNPKTRELNKTFMERISYLSSKNIWFTTVSELLDFLMQQYGKSTISKWDRFKLELKWLVHKVKYGSA